MLRFPCNLPFLPFFSTPAIFIHQRMHKKESRERARKRERASAAENTRFRFNVRRRKDTEWTEEKKKRGYINLNVRSPLFPAWIIIVLVNQANSSPSFTHSSLPTTTLSEIFYSSLQGSHYHLRVQREKKRERERERRVQGTGCMHIKIRAYHYSCCNETEDEMWFEWSFHWVQLLQEK